MENNKFLINFIVVVTVSFIGLCLIKVFDISYPLTLVTTSKSSELAVVGEGKIEVTPDTAYVDAGITVDNRQTVLEVQATISTINNKIIEAMKNIGVEKTDIKTSSYSVNPNYVYDNNQNKITGYNGNATIQIRVRNTEMASKVIEEATKAGANQIQGERFTVDNPEKYREEARNKAIQNAKDQAEKMAKSLGIKLGKIVNIIESTPDNSSNFKYDALPMAGGGAGGSGLNIEQGSQTLTSTVTLYFEKK